MAWLSPTLLMRQSLDELSGVGAARWFRFYDQINAFQQDWCQMFERRVLPNELIRSDEIETWPRFVWQEEPLRIQLGRVGVACGVWLAAASLLIALARWRLAQHHRHGG